MAAIPADEHMRRRRANNKEKKHGLRKPTHWTPHSPTLITAGVENDEVLLDIFIGGKFKGVGCGVEWHYGSEEQAKKHRHVVSQISLSHGAY